MSDQPSNQREDDLEFFRRLEEDDGKPPPVRDDADPGQAVAPGEPRSWLTPLLARGVNSVVTTYDGYGDSGAVQEIEFRDGDGEPLDIDDQDIVHAVEELVLALLSDTVGGWEIDAGSGGTVTIWPESGEYTVDHEQRAVEYETYEGGLW